MLFKSVVGKTTLLVYQGCKKKLSKKQKECDLVVFAKNFQSKSKSNQINILKETTKIKLYKEDNGDLYISNYDEEQELLNCPIQEIYVKSGTFEIQFSHVKLCGLLNQQRNITEDFLMDYEAPEVSSKKKRKCVDEESDVSHDLFEDVEELEEENDDERGESSEYSSSNLLPTSSLSVEMPPKMRIITPCTNDQKTQRKNLIEEMKEKLEILFNGPSFSVVQKLIPTNQLVSNVDIEKDDKVVQEFIESAKDQGSLPEADAVTVFRRDEAYHVISGSRRVVAQKQLGTGMMAVNIVKSIDAKQFKMRKFFREHVVKDPLITETIDRFSDIFEYLDVTKDTLRKWNEKEVQELFGKYLGEHTKLSILLKISIFEDLSDVMKRISREIETLSIRLLISIVQKYKLNRVETMRFLGGFTNAPYDETAMRKGLDQIEASVHSLLSKKILDSAVVDRFIDIYGNDPMLEIFARKGSIRKRSSGQRFETICRQFERFKVENRLEVDKSSKIVSVGTSPLACQMLISEKPSLIKNWSQNGTYDGDRIGLLIGTVEESASFSFLMVLPDSLSPRGNHGCLCSVVSVSIFIFRNKRLVVDNDVELVFAECNLPFRSHYTVTEIVKLIGSPSDSFYDDGIVLREGLAAELVKNSSIVQVNNTEMKTKLSNLLMA